MKYDNSVVRRQDRLLDEGRARELLAAAEYGVLSMVGADGAPYGVPVNYVADGDCAYVHCAPEGRKLASIQACPRVSLCVVGRVHLLPDKFTTEYESIVLAGRATVVRDHTERQRAIELLLDKLSPDHKATGLRYAAASMHRTAIIRIDFDTFTGKCKLLAKPHCNPSLV